MCTRAFIVAVLSILTISVGIAQQSDTAPQELQLNLEQFPDTKNTPMSGEKEDLELNLEQFDKTDNSNNAASDEGLKLNLEQFDNSSQTSSDSNSNSLEATKTEGADVPRFNLKRILFIGGLVFLVLYFISRKRKRLR